MKIGDKVKNIYVDEISIVLVPNYKNTDNKDLMVILVPGVACPQIVDKNFYKATGDNEPFILELIQELAEDLNTNNGAL